MRGGDPPIAAVFWASWWPICHVDWFDAKGHPVVPFADPRGLATVKARIARLDPTLIQLLETASWEQLAGWIATLDPEARISGDLND